MLDSITIVGFRSCYSANLRLGEPIVALVGKNGAGKTNLLRAIEFVARSCGSQGDSDPWTQIVHEPHRTVHFELRFTIEKAKFQYSITLPANRTEPFYIEEHLLRDEEVVFERKGETLTCPSAASLPTHFRINARVNSLAVLTQLIPGNEAVYVHLALVAKYLDAVRYYPLTERIFDPRQYSPFIEGAQYESWKSRLAQGKPGETVAMRLLHLFLTNDKKLDEIKALVGDNGLGLISDIRIEKVDSKRVGGELAYSMFFIPCSGLAGAGRVFRHSGLSAGTWRVLQLLTYLVFDDSACMLVEQPEDSIHAGLLAKVFNILSTYAGRTQLICTTHSAKVINLVGAQGVRRITSESGRTQINELTKAEVQASKSYISDEGTLAEFLDTL